MERTLLGSPAGVGGGTAGWRSLNTRRPPTMVQVPPMRASCRRPVKMSAFAGRRRDIHTPSVILAPPPGGGFRSPPAATPHGPTRGSRVVVTRAMFESFTEKAIKVVMLAQEETRHLGHRTVGSEQILLGLVGEGTGIAAKVLRSAVLNLKDARAEVEKVLGTGPGFVPEEIPFTPSAKKVIETSIEESRQLGHNYIGSEHLLLGLIREENGAAAIILKTFQADPSRIRSEVIRMINETSEDQTVSAGVGGGSTATKTPTLEEYGTNLTKLAEEEIALIMLGEVSGRMREKGIELRVTESFNELVVEEGFDPRYGAWPLRRAIMRLLEDTPAEEIKAGDWVIVDADSAGKAVVLNQHGDMPELQPPAFAA